MDFSALLSEAQKNEHQKQSTACYQTKFTPPKRQSKQTKALSDNIKKFLARKDDEERRKALEEKKKRENLLALRDHKAQSRINKHLKVCKAANKSVLADAVDNENTAVTIAGPSQPDEDDYGYVSQEASALYNQIINKYNNAPLQKPLFSSSGKKTVKDIASTKDRVKQALRQQEVEEALGYRRKRKSTKDGDPEEKSEKEAEKPSVQGTVQTEKPKTKKRPPPPPDFTQLLKIAEKKQHEPVVIEVKAKLEEPERLRTKRQMREYEKEREWRDRKEQRERNASEQTSSKPTAAPIATKPKPVLGKIPKASDKQTVPTKSSTNVPVTPASFKKPVNVQNDKSVVKIKPKVSARDEILEAKKELEAEKRKLQEMRLQIEEEKKQLALSKSKQQEEEKKIQEKAPVKEKPILPNGKPKQFPPADMKPLKPKLSRDNRRPLANKRRIYDEDEEYDSELDDFIDDGAEEGSEDYSKYISEIFGYDKSKYRNVDDADDFTMESSFAQQLKEEHVSTKIGIMEDLEDIRMEALEKKRKALMRKKVKK